MNSTQGENLSRALARFIRLPRRGNASEVRSLLLITAWQRWRKKGWHQTLFFKIFVVPVFLYTIYIGLFAADRYASEAGVVVMSSEERASGFDLGMLLTGPTASQKDAMLVKEYIHSLDMLLHLDKTLGLLQHYKSLRVDVFSMLLPWLSPDESLDYYRDHIEIRFDETSGVLLIKAQAFDPKFAKLLTDAILNQAEAFINQIGHDLAKSRMEFVNQELERAHKKMRDAKKRMVDFANQHGLVAPDEQSKSLVGVVNQLSAELTRHEAELKNLLSFMNPNAYEVVALRSKIEAIKEQIRGEHGNFVASGDQALAKLTAEYHDLILDFNFAQDAYKTALTTMERARIDSYRKSKYLVQVNKPSIPQYAKYPQFWRNLFTFAFMAIVIYGLIVLGREIIREHRA